MRRRSKLEDFSKLGKDDSIKVYCAECGNKVEAQYQDLGGRTKDRVYVCWQLGMVHYVRAEETLKYDWEFVKGFYYTDLPTEPVYRMVEVQDGAVAYTKLVQLSDSEAEKYLLD